VWADGEGKVEEIATVPFAWPHFDLSRDGSRLALAGRDRGLVRIAILDLARKTLTPFREETLDYPAMPVWSPDGGRIYFSRFGTHEGEILSQAVDGASPESLAKLPGTWLSPHSLSLDGRFLVFSIYHPETASAIWFLDLAGSGGEGAARPFLTDALNQCCPALSPDGHWLAYASGETGRSEIYLRRFPGGESKVRVSAEGGNYPLWSPDGRVLFIQSVDGSKVTAVPIQTTPALRIGKPRLILEGRFAASSDMGLSYAVSPDGRRLLMTRQQEDPRTASELIVIQNWFEEIERLAGAGGR
jgi:Tol biopolymer transport system component